MQEKSIKDWLRSLPTEVRELAKKNIKKYAAVSLNDIVTGPLSKILFIYIKYHNISSVEIDYWRDLDAILEEWEADLKFRGSYPAHIFPSPPLE